MTIIKDIDVTTFKPMQDADGSLQTVFESKAE